MNPLGIALAFVLFWATIGLGLFLMFSSGVRLSRRRSSVGVVARFITTEGTRQAVDLLVNWVLMLIGASLTYVGGVAIYNTIYR